MRGAKEGKADGGKQQEAGPALFPRLHVAETKKTGPRGPPRNKMALYEQLTIPSHKFKPSPMPLPSSGRTMKSPCMTTPIYIPQGQAGSHDIMYSYMPMSYMNPAIIPTMTCMPMMHSGHISVESTSSLISSSSKSTVVDGATEFSMGGANAHAPKSLSHSKHCAPSRKGRGDEDFAVPTYSSATQSSGQTRTSSPLQNKRGSRGERALVRDKELVMEKRSRAFVNQDRRITTEKSMEVMSRERKDDQSRPITGGECVPVSGIDNDGYSQETNHSELDGVRVEYDDGHARSSACNIRQEEVWMQKSEAGQNVVRTSETHATVHRTENLRRTSDQDVISNMSSEDQSEELSEPSQQKRGSSTETGSSLLEDMGLGSVCFRDVVDAFGQQEYWKTQSLIIRQQSLFSRQVFELHRVIAVQHLLAKTPCLSLSIDVLEEEDDNNVHVPASPIAEVPEVAAVPAIDDAPEVPEIPIVPEVPERRSETTVCHDSTEHPRPVPESLASGMYPMSIPSQHGFNPQSVWQAAPYVANPWAARMASPYMYIPYPPPCPPGYGTYPMMGAPMPMYGYAGGMQAARFSSWPQPGLSQPWSAPNSVAAAAAWYGQQVVPAVAPPAITAVASPACNIECLASSGSGQSVESSSQMGGGLQAGEASDIGGNRSNKGESMESHGWTKGWGRKEGRWVRGDRSLVHTTTASADLRGDEPDYPDGADLRNRDAGCGVAERRDEGDQGDQVAERQKHFRECAELEPGESLEGSLHSRSLKHMRTEGLEPGACRWFPILSPAKRPMHQSGVIKVVPRAVSAAPELAANILLSIETDRRR